MMQPTDKPYVYFKRSSIFYLVPQPQNMICKVEAFILRERNENLVDVQKLNFIFSQKFVSARKISTVYTAGLIIH